MAQSRGPILKLALALFGAAALGMPALGAERLVIPFQISDLEHMQIPLEINGTTITTGVVDTAATFPMIDGRTALRSGVTAPDAATPRVSILGVNGVKDYPIVRLGSVRSGNVRLDAFEAAFSRDLDIPGSAANVLPASAFPGDILEFDFRARKISAYDGQPDKPETALYDIVPYELDGGLMYVTIRINGRKGRALIDTGSNLTYVNSVFADLSGLKTNPEKTQLLQGATGGDQSLRVATARRVRLGDFNFGNADLFVSDPALFRLLGIDKEPVMVIGLDFLSEFRVQIDRRRSRMVLSLPDIPFEQFGVELNARDTRLR
ncbi:aspartyl protease family protein [Hyphomonas sp.]|jgi:predicted aspartyl protease|uniref:aspartyl protease family protein n=1 Tax=Hyphomonas sp. TaxID=87 RepID=UPI0025BFBEA2|nr:aspartyl protease family protein [Hyphomonas sp.]